MMMEKLLGGLLERYSGTINILIYLWVDNSLRGKGYDKELLNHIEKTARENNCRLILLDSFSFQAPEFYLKFGYKVVGIIEDARKDINSII